MEVDRVQGKVFEEAPGFPTQYGPDRSDRQPGSPLVPHETYRDLVSIFLLVAMSFFLTAWIVPSLETPRNPAQTPFIVPDWYVLFSYGLLKLAEILPEPDVPGVLGLPAFRLTAGFWGFFLTNIPLIILVVLPFVDRGRENRPAKAPLRSAFGVSFLFVWMFFASMYSVNNLILEKWPVIADDNVLKAFFFGPPFLSFVAAYVGLRRLGYSPMYWYRVVPLMAAFLITAGHSAYILATIGAHPQWGWIAAFLGLLTSMTLAPAVASAYLPEKAALRATVLSSAFLSLLGVLLWLTFWYYSPGPAYATEVVIVPNMHTVLALPVFSVITGYVGLRRPYSTYEYLLNECYQCGKCHTVCPVTKVEDDALGGLNLVYNSFKKEHDGVPLWTCLACDACSAVCPLDIQYSDYILEERAKVMGQSAVDGGEER